MANKHNYGQKSFFPEENQPEIFSDADWREVAAAKEEVKAHEPVVCLGLSFDSEEERREHFRAELRKRLPDLRKIEGFPIGEDDDIIALSDPPYYTACPNPWLNDFIAQWEQEKANLEADGLRSPDFEVKEPYANDVKVGKGNPVYTAHTYHTKVPHPAIMRYLLYYTQPGDIVFDGFAGTGMTGVAAYACGNPDATTKSDIETTWKKQFGKKPIWGDRHALISDLSSYAYSIAYNYNNGVRKIDEFHKEALRIFDLLKKEIAWMYETHDEKGNKGLINYTVWSDYFFCNECGREFRYWDVAMDFNAQQILDDYRCPYCGCVHNSKNRPVRVFETIYDEVIGKSIQIAKSTPVFMVYTVDGVRKQKKPDEFDLQLIHSIEEQKYPDIIPNFELPYGIKTREPKRTHGVTHVHLYNTKRNTLALGKALELMEKSKFRDALKFIFTGMINRSSKMNRMHVGNFFHGGGGWNVGHMKGTLYIPNIPIETSILEQYEDKLNSYLRAMPFLPDNNCNLVSICDAGNTPVSDNSIDYIFTDPPFGANIMYSELNYLPEAWLRVVTNNEEEAIINETQNKDFLHYLNAMTHCYQEFFRILKPRKWMTVEFSNTNAAIWNTIQQALIRAGFVIANVSALNKGQGGQRANTTTTAVKQDLAISCYKPSESIQNIEGDLVSNVWNFVEEHLEHLPAYILNEDKFSVVPERDPRILYDRVVSYFVQKGVPIPLDSKEFQNGLRQRFIERDNLFFTAPQAAEYDEKKRTAPQLVSLGIIVSNEVEGIQWLHNTLHENPKTYAELQPEWMKAINGVRKGDILPELKDILDENFIQMEDGRWREPNIQDDVDKEALREKSLLREWKKYVEVAEKPKGKLKQVRVEALRAGFKQCYKDKDFKTIVMVGDRIPQNLRDEDEVLLQFYDIALNKI